MYKRSILLLICSLSFMILAAQKTDKKLQRQIEDLITGFNGNIGIYVKNLKNGKTVHINADTIFPTASMVKIPILIGVMDKINKGELAYHQNLQYRDSLLYAGVDILGSFKDTERIELSKVMMLMLTMSDNTASLWLQNLADKGTRINELMDSAGFTHTRVNSRTPGRESNRTQYGWGQTTPYEMAVLMDRTQPALSESGRFNAIENNRRRPTQQVPGDCPVGQANRVFKRAGPGLAERIRALCEPGFEQLAAGIGVLGFAGQIKCLRQCDQFVVAIQFPQVFDVTH